MRFIKNILDEDLKETLQKASEAFLIRSGGLVINFLFNVYLARLFGAEGTGTYYLAFTVVSLGSLLGSFGLENVLIRYIAINYSNRNFGKIKGHYLFSIALTVSISVFISLLLFLTASFISENIFHDPSLAQPLKYMVFSIIPFSLLNIIASLLKGIKNIRDSILISGALIPLFLLLISFVIQNSFGIIGIIIAYNLSTLIVFLYSLWRWHLKIPNLNKHKAEFDNKLILNSAYPMLGIAIMNLILLWSNTFILGMYAETDSVGIFNIALRTATLTSLLLTAINSIIAPKFATLYQKKDMKSLEKLARNTSFIITVLSGSILIIFILFPSFILSLFGKEFVEGATVLVILSFGQFINSATGSVGYLLMMSGNEKLLRNNVTFVAILSVILNLLVIPKYHIIGAAIVTAFCMALMNIISTFLVYKKTSILVIPSLKK
jgi:O-antigen/teichoic acid export membrane protein